MMSEKLAPQVLFEPLSESEAAVLDIEQHSFFTLNESAKYLFEQLQTGASVEELTAAMAREFDVDESECRADIESFLTELRSRGLLL